MSNPFGPQTPQPNLAQVSEATLMALAQQGNPQFTHAALMEQASAQQQRQQMGVEKNIEVPKVNFYPSRHPDPRKARKYDIKQAYRLLKPTKRSLFDPRRWIGSTYRYAKDSGTCCVDGCNVKELIQYDNLYARISDEETGVSLWELYWQNPVTHEPEAFVAHTGVTSGRPIKATYCPEHLHLYHLLCTWEEQEEREEEMLPSRFRDKVKKGVSIVTVPVSTLIGDNQQHMPEMLTKYEPFFDQLQIDSKKTSGISLMHYKNPETGLNDVTMIVFDLRMFQKELNEINQPTQSFQDVLAQQVIQPSTVPPIMTQPSQVVMAPPVTPENNEVVQ